jgi:hypothetical protein
VGSGNGAKQRDQDVQIRQEGVLPASRSAPEDYDIEDGRITTIYLVRNPDKLRQH